MSHTRIGSWIRRALWVFLATLFLASSISLLNGLLDPVIGSLSVFTEPSPAATGSTPVWRQVLVTANDAPPQPFSATLTFNGRATQDGLQPLIAVAELHVPKTHPLVTPARNLMREDVDGFLDAVIGQIRVNRARFRFRPPEVEVLPDRDDARIVIRGSYQSRFETLEQYVSIAPPSLGTQFPQSVSRIVVKSDGVRVLGPEAPRTQTTTETVWDRNSSGFFAFSLTDANPDRARPGAQDDATTAAPAYRRVLDSVLSYSSFRAVEMVPGVLMLLWLTRFRAEVGRPGVRIAALAALIVSILGTELVVSIVNTVTSATGSIPRIVGERFGPEVEGPDFRFYATGGFVLLLSLAAAGWPSTMGSLITRFRKRSNRARVATAWTVAIVVSFGVAVLIAVYVEDSIGFDPTEAAFAYGLPALPLIFAASAALLRALGRRRGLLVSALLLSSVVVLFTALETLTNVGPDAETPISATANAVLFMLAGVPLLVALSRFVLRFWSRSRRDVAARLRRVPVLTIAAVALLPLLAARDAYAPQAIDVWNLVPELARFATFCLMAITVRWMSRAASVDTWPKCSEATLGAGLVLSMSSLFSTGNWWDVVVQLISGYVMLRYVLFSDPSGPAGVALATHWRAQLIGRTIAFNELARVAKTLKKELLARLSKGEITHLTYRSKLEPVEQELENAKRERTNLGQYSREAALAFGPTASAWENATIMLRWGLGFASPWIALSLRDLPRNRDWYGLLPVVNSGLNIAARWTLLLLFFGYFYAYIRGRSGLQKALWIALAVVTPSALSTVLFSQQWQGLSFWALQVLTTLMLTGLTAGDFETLRRAGFRWRDLIEVHNVGALSAWASTLILALGTTATTLLTSGLGTFVTAALQFAGVLPTQPPQK